MSRISFVPTSDWAMSSETVAADSATDLERHYANARSRA